MDQAMGCPSVDVKKDPIRLQRIRKNYLVPEVQYYIAIGTLVYLANSTRLDVGYAKSLLARYSSYPTRSFR